MVRLQQYFGNQHNIQCLDELLEDLAEDTEDNIYQDLTKISEGDKIKIVISEVVEKDDFWAIDVEVYSGKNLDQRGEDFETKVYKKPDGLVDSFFSSDDGETYSLYFLPVDTKTYLEKFESLVLECDDYLEEEFELSVDGRELIFDYTPYGYYDTFIQEYSDDGIINILEILYNGDTVLKRELIDSYEDYSYIISTVFIIIISVVSAICISYFFVIKKRKRETDSKTIINKMLKDVK